MLAPNADVDVETLSVYAVNVVESEDPFTVVAKLVMVCVSVIVVAKQGSDITTVTVLEVAVIEV